jgi:hypothetical protein
VKRLSFFDGLPLDRIIAIHERPWNAVTNSQMAVASLGMIWLLYLIKTSEEGFIFLDYANLVFHEAGHPIFGLLGETMGLYGGTIGQLVFRLPRQPRSGGKGSRSLCGCVGLAL